MAVVSRSLAVFALVLLVPVRASAQAAHRPGVLDAPSSFGPSRFAAPVVVTGERRRFESLLDLDGDGNQDAYGWWWKDIDYRYITVNGWTNDGNGKLVERWGVQIDSNVVGAGTGNFRGAAAGNLDGDARADFALAFWDKIFLYRSNGAIAPSLYDLIVVGSSQRGFVLADFDQDGLDDVAVYDGSVRLYLNQGSGQPFALAQTYPAINSLNISLLVIDANGDSTPDLLYDSGGTFHFLYVQDGAVTGEALLTHGYPAPFPRKNLLSAGDIDGDGDVDVAAFDSGGGVFIARREGPAAFTIEAKHDAGPATNLIDIDGDGDLDGLCCGGGGETPPPYNSTPSFYEFSYYEGGTFGPTHRIEGLGSHHLAGATDLDGDGDLDLVAGRTVLWNDQGFDQPPPRNASTAALGLPEAVVPETMGDFDGDGDPDFGIGLGSLVVTFGDGDFDSADVSADPPPANAWRGPGVVGDFDGDGDPDLLVSRVSGFAGQDFQALHLLANNGAGVLHDAGTATAPGVDPSQDNYPCRDNPTCYRVGDLDGDGDLDFASPLGTVFWNDGTGFFAQGPGFPGERIVAIHDVDGDGLGDLVLENDVLLVRLNLGSGAFDGPIVLPTDVSSSVRPAIGDFDGDGRTDIANYDLTLGKVRIHWNQGAGSFTHANIQVALNAGPNLLAVDVDHDGIDDLVAWPVANAGSSCMTARSRGGRAWDFPITQVFQPSVFVDVDADGDLDAVGNTVVLSQRRLNPAAGLRRQYGAGSQGPCTQPAPVLGATGPLRMGKTFTYRMCGIEPGALGVLTLGRGDSTTPWSGVNVLNWPWQQSVMLPPAKGSVGIPGSGVVQLEAWISPALVRSGPVFAQALFQSPCAPSAFVATNGLELDFGF